MKKFGSTTCVSLVVLAAASGSSHADGWFWQNNARVFTEQNDNVYLSTTDPIDAASIGVAARSTISLESEVSRAAITPSVSYRQYSSDEDLDHGSAGLDVDLMKVYERTAVGLKGGYERNTTLTSELEDSGRLQNKIDRNNIRVEPFFRYKFTPLSGIKVGFAYRLSDYVDGEVRGYYDYDQQQVNLAYELDMTRRDLLSATVFSSRYNADALDNETTTTGLELGWQHRFSEYTDTLVSAGGYQLDSEFSSGGTLFEDSSNGALFRVQLNHRTPLNRFSLGGSSKLEPSSVGIVRRNHRLDASVNHLFSERVSANLTGVVLRVDSTDERYSGDDRDYYSLDTGVAWHLDALWRLRAGYRYAKQQYDNATESSDSSRVSVSIEYNSLKHNF